MKKFLVFIFSFLCVFSEAQVLLPVNNYGTEENRIKFREYLGLPRKDTSIMGINLVTNPGADTGQIRYLKDDSTVYVHTGTHWWKVGGGAITPDAWSLTGNLGTTDGVNFIGTTDNIPLNFRVNNIKAGRLDATLRNAVFGTSAEFNLTTGHDNTAIGHAALNANISNHNNTAIGSFSSLNVSGGANNTTVGVSSLSNTNTGSDNTAIGYQSITANTTGSNITAIGSRSNVSGINLNNATAIGYRAYVSADNTMTLGSINGVNGAAADTKVGIGTDAATEKLHIENGTIRIVTGNQALNKVFTSDANGVGDWQTVSDANAWKLTGNAGTIDGTNFIGTTDDIPFNIRINNVKSGRIHRVERTAFFGYQSGLNATGSDNTGFGYQTLMNSVLPGGQNVAVGAEALKSTTTGEQNTAVGNHALSQNTTGSGNTALGPSNLADNTTGGYNVALGYGALFNNDNGNQNIAIGRNVMLNNTSGSDNIAFGRDAGNTNVSGTKNINIGYASALNANNLINAVAIGAYSRVDASNSLILGSINGINGASSDTKVGIGTTTPSEKFHVVGTPRFVTGNEANGKVWTSNATGVGDWVDLPSDPNAWSILGNSGTIDGTNFLGTNDNVPLNFRVNNEKSGRIDPTLQSTFFGYQSGNVTTGMYNTAYGYQSLLNNIGGSANTAFGNSALGSNISGLNNTAIGSGSLFGNTTGDRNTALGFDALLQNNDGAENVSIGHDNLGQNSDGSGNTSVGFAAMTNNDHGGGNTSLGYESLVGNVDGNSNTAIGNAADVLSPALTNATAIGANAAVNQSNSLVLGSINGVNGATDDVNVGIGTTTPDTRLHVVGNIKMEDGNEGLNKIMVSDANGVGSWTTLNPMKNLITNFTDAGNVGTGEDDLMTYAIPAGQLSTNGDYIEFTMTFVFAINANNKQIKVYYGASNIYSSTAQPQSSGSMEIKGTIIRTGATSQRISFSQSNNTTNYADYADYKISSETLANAITLKATGEATSNNDIIQKILTVKYIPSN